MDTTDGSGGRPTSLWRALRADPSRAAEVAVLYSLPLLSPHVARWSRRRRQRHPGTPADAVARHLVWRAAGVARRGGIVTGSSFYVGMVPAMAMIYCEQLALVLRIAAVYGRDPLSPERAAEILVVQGRYRTVAEAALALRAVGQGGSRQEGMASETRTVATVLRQLPSLIGVTVRRLSNRSAFDAVLGAAEVASFVFPVVSIPVWALSNARATRRLGRAAADFYRLPVADLDVTPVVLPPRPPRRVRRLSIGCVVPLALALGVLVTLLPGGTAEHGLRWAGLAIGEASLVLIFARLVRITRVDPAPSGDVP